MLHYRELTLDSPDESNRIVEASLSSETPVDRPGLGREVLVHTPDAVDLSRSPLPLITSHNRSETPVGVVENIRIQGNKLRGTLRFGGSSRALDIWEDVKAGVLRNLSIGYQILKGEKRGDFYYATRWTPFEVSLVSAPADINIGIGRSFNKGNTMPNQDTHIEMNNMSRSQRRSMKRTDGDEKEAKLEIFAMAQQFDIPTEQVREFTSTHGYDDRLFRNYVIDYIKNPKNTGSVRFDESPTLGLSGGDIQRYSFTRAIMAQVDPASFFNKAGFELEASRALAKKLGHEPSGFFVPPEILMERSMMVGTPSAGGHLRPTEHLGNSFIDVLRNASHVMGLGATHLNGLRGDITIPKKDGTTTGTWVDEGKAPPETNITFGQISLSPKTIAGWTSYTRKLMLQSSPDIETLVRSDLAQTLSVELDRAAIDGSGVGAEPLGILNTSGVSAVLIGDNGGKITWEHLLDLEQSLANQNADAGNLAYLTSTKIRRQLKSALRVPNDAAGGFVWGDGNKPGQGIVNGYLALASNNVPSDLTKGTSVNSCSAAIFGNWSDLFIGQWGALDIIVDPYTLSTSGGFRVSALLDVDIALRRAYSFAVIKDALID